MQQGRWVDPALGNMRLEIWVEEFLRTATDLDVSTRATYERDLRRYVLPRFGAQPMNRIRKLDIRAWINDELTAGVAPSSVHRHFRTLRRVLNVAVDYELSARSPCTGIPGPRVPAKEMRFLTAGQVMDVAEAIHPRFSTLVYTAAYTGMRWGELIGLRRQQLDLHAPAVTVVDQLVLVDGAWQRKAPKTAAGRRRITLPDFLAQLLDRHLEHHAPGPDGLVFPNTRGNPLHPSSFNTHHWTPAKARVGLAGVRFHDLRHTAVALAIAQGAHPKAIQVRMGHASVGVTLDRYGHLFPELDHQVAEGLDRTFRTTLRLLRGGAEGSAQDTARTQKTRPGQNQGS
jgi:integrase